MAFQLNALDPSNSGSGGAALLGTYRTADNFADTLAEGYFNEAAGNLRWTHALLVKASDKTGILLISVSMGVVTATELGGGNGNLPSGTVNQTMGFDANGNPVAKMFMSQMWGDLLVGFPDGTAWVAILLEDGSHAFVPASVNNAANRIAVRNAASQLFAAASTEDNQVVVHQQLNAALSLIEALELRVAALEA